jgi:hypothetical protein
VSFTGAGGPAGAVVEGAVVAGALVEVEVVVGAGATVVARPVVGAGAGEVEETGADVVAGEEVDGPPLAPVFGLWLQAAAVSATAMPRTTDGRDRRKDHDCTRVSRPGLGIAPGSARAEPGGH